jgi:hypothetical protein
LRRVEILFLQRDDRAVENTRTDFRIALQRVGEILQERIARSRRQRTAGIEHGCHFIVG